MLTNSQPMPSRSPARVAFRGLIAGAGVLVLVGCADTDPDRMALSQFPGPVPLKADIQSGICVRTVTGGEDTVEMMGPAFGRVKTQDFQQALSTTLRNLKLLAASSDCRYRLDANILGLSRPAIVGPNPEVVASINYKLFDAGNSPVLLESVTTSYTSSMSESLGGAVRMERAGEGAIRANIAEFLRRLAKLQKG